MKYLRFVGLFLVSGIQVFAGDIVVTVQGNQCQAIVAGVTYVCSAGKNGITREKVEGDGTTPIGAFPLRRIYFRPDKIDEKTIQSQNLPIAQIQKHDGWCDASGDPNYNRLVDLRAFNQSISHERLWREDGLYNLVIEVGYNDFPPISAKGSAIFIHIAREAYAPTAGCIAFSKEDLLKIISQIDSHSQLIVKG